MVYSEKDISLLFKALKFAAETHRYQKRKDVDATPYINHPINVAYLLIYVGKEYDVNIIQAAILHDTIEDTETTAAELNENFGEKVTALVQELTDDKTLPKQVRKDLQIKKAPFLSAEAKKIKICDKISNITDITYHPPKNWSIERKKEYFDWAEQLVIAMQEVNTELEILFYKSLKEGRGKLNGIP